MNRRKAWRPELARALSVYHPGGRLGLGANPFGKDIANFQLYRALAQHGGFEEFALLSLNPPPEAEARQALGTDVAGRARITSASVFDHAVAARTGALL